MSEKLSLDARELLSLPSNWCWATLDELMKKIVDGTHHTPIYVEDGVPFLSVKDVRDGKIYFDNCKYISQEQHKELCKRCYPEQGDLLITKSGTIGRCALVNTKREFSLFVSVALLKPATDDVNTSFISLAFQAWFQTINVQNDITGSAIKNFHLVDFRKLALPLPPLNEQRRIVAKIEGLKARSQRVKEELEAIPALLDQFRQSVLAAAFRGDLTADWREKNPDVEPASVLLERIRAERRRRWEEAELEKMKAQGKTPKDDKWKEKYKDISSRGARQLVAEIRAGKYKLDNLPAGWSAIRLGQISQLQTGYAFKSNWFASDGIRLLRGTNIVPGNTRWEDVVYLPEERTAEFKEYMLQKGDIIIAMDRPVISSGLKIAKLGANDVPSLLLQRVGRFQLEEGIDPDFILNFLNSQIFLSHIQDQATGTQLPHISANDVESVIIPLPPVKEQKAIVKLINAWSHRIDSVAELTHSGFADLETLNQSILAKAFQGELVPQNPNDEPASVLLERIRAEREKLDTGKKTKGKAEKKSRKAKPEAAPEQLNLPGFE